MKNDQNVQLPDDEFKVWARNRMREMLDTAKAVTEELGLPPEDAHQVMRWLYENKIPDPKDSPES